ncbi:hypothetical protein D3C80_1697460 [compost metagenome]
MTVNLGAGIAIRLIGAVAAVGDRAARSQINPHTRIDGFRGRRMGVRSLCAVEQDILARRKQDVTYGRIQEIDRFARSIDASRNLHTMTRDRPLSCNNSGRASAADFGHDRR